MLSQHVSAPTERAGRCSRTVQQIPMVREEWQLRANMQAQQSQGIQTLLEAEKEASQIVDKARACGSATVWCGADAQTGRRS